MGGATLGRKPRSDRSCSLKSSREMFTPSARFCRRRIGPGGNCSQGTQSEASRSLNTFRLSGLRWECVHTASLCCSPPKLRTANRPAWSPKPPRLVRESADERKRSVSGRQRSCVVCRSHGLGRDQLARPAYRRFWATAAPMRSRCAAPVPQQPPQMSIPGYRPARSPIRIARSAGSPSSRWPS